MGFQTVAGPLTKSVLYSIHFLINELQIIYQKMASFVNDLKDLTESGDENELAQSIKLEKASKPSMFISGWEEDDNDIEEKVLFFCLLKFNL